MAKSNLKVLLVAFSTTREVDGKPRRVRFAAKSTVDLTADELETLDKLEKSTGKLHYRDPINESGTASESQPEVVETPDYAGQDVPMNRKNVDQLKAFLTHHSVTFESDASKTDLLKAAEAKQAEIDGGSGDDNGL